MVIREGEHSHVEKKTYEKVADIIKTSESNGIDLQVRPGQINNFRRIVGK
jgi:hypothetical protein